MTTEQPEQATQEDSGDGGYWQHPIKCLNCSLHFMVCSWYEQWPDHGTTRELKVGEATGVVHCPECGSHDRMLVYTPRKIDHEIFVDVGGEQHPRRLGL